MIEEDSHAPGSLTRFLTILFSFCVLELLSWPILFSYYLWVFADRSNLLNLDYLLAQHLRLGVDTFYSYGLLPVFIQHVLFAIFGRGYWPMIGCTIVVLVLMATFWSLFVRCVSNRWSYVIAVIAISPFILWINPNFPYSLVQLSMLFGLLFLLKGRPDVALAVSVIGCFSVPSLPLILTGLLAVYVVVDWWTGANRSISFLARRLAPSISVYVLLAAGLSAFFGFQSVLATALPVMGAKYYYGSKRADFTDLMKFVHPIGHSLKYYVAYYIGTPAGWWILCSISLVVLGIVAAIVMLRNRKLDPRHSVVLFCAVLQVFFAFVAYRGDDQHMIYDPVTATGMFVGISIFPVKRFRNLLLLLFVCVGVLGQAEQVRRTVWAWKNTHRSALTANLYAETEYGPQLTKILDIANMQKVLMMSNATGVHHYYPTLKPVNTWFLVAGLLSPQDRVRVLASMRDADVIVEDTTHAPWFIDRDPEAIRELQSMCLTDVTRDFQIWWRHPSDSAACKVNPRQMRRGAASADPENQ
jgi:hypothetical protein